MKKIVLLVIVLFIYTGCAERELIVSQSFDRIYFHQSNWDNSSSSFSMTWATVDTDSIQWPVDLTSAIRAITHWQHQDNPNMLSDEAQEMLNLTWNISSLFPTKLEEAFEHVLSSAVHLITPSDEITNAYLNIGDDEFILRVSVHIATEELAKKYSQDIANFIATNITSITPELTELHIFFAD